MKRVLPVLCAALLVVVLTGVANAQGTASTDTSAEPVFPDATSLGKGWVELLMANNNKFSNVFTAFERHVYGGPEGSLVYIEVMPFTPEPLFGDDPWTTAVDLFTTNHQFFADNHLANEEPQSLGSVKGCTEIERFDDPVSNYWQPLAMTLCGYGSKSPDDFSAGAVEVMVFGSVGGIQGRQASDAIASRVAALQSEE